MNENLETMELKFKLNNEKVKGFIETNQQQSINKMIEEK
jgi:hypothetical protein